MGKTITACKDCKGCIHFEIIDKYYMHCKARDKKYMYGQSVPCEDKEKKVKRRRQKNEYKN